jgi:hypothetical protein
MEAVETHSPMVTEAQTARTTTAQTVRPSSVSEL